MKIINGEKVFTGKKVPIKFLAEKLGVNPIFIRESIKQRIGLFANIGIILDEQILEPRGGYRERARIDFYISDKEVYDTFKIEYIED